MKISVVIPVYNGARTIGPLIDRLKKASGARDLQIVLVNDGSPDESDAVCREIQARYPGSVVYVKLAKNFGEHNAVMAGLHHATGDHVVIMDDDFQNPPEEVFRLVNHAVLHDLDVVYSRYARKCHHWFRNLGSRFNDRVATVLLDKPRDLYLSSFKCLNQFTVREVVKYAGPYPYLDGLVLRCTRNVGTLEVRHDARCEGRSNYTLRKLVRLWLNMFVNFSVLPLRLSALLGLVCGILGLFLGVVVIVERLTRPETPIGWASVIVTMLLFSGVQFLMLGLMGEYVGRLFLSGNQTPQFVVREVFQGGAPSCQSRRSLPTSKEAASSSPEVWDFSGATSPSDLSSLELT
ncbi:MAG: glycosyltransferase family 2 protein [Isosphaeraceae bacterium]